MFRALVTQKWPSSSTASRLCHTSDFVIALPLSLRQPAAKFSSATLGAGSAILKQPRQQHRNSVLRSPLDGGSTLRSYASGRPTLATSVNTQNEQNPRPLDTRQVAALADGARDRLLETTGIPSEEDVLAALQECTRAAALARNSSTAHVLNNKPAGADTSASSLLSLDRSTADLKQPSATKVSDASGPSQLIHHISKVAYEIVSHPIVIITPQILDSYVEIQAQLGGVEILPHVLELYASKPKPRLSHGSVEYVPQNPNNPTNAMQPDTIEKALDIAIEAKNLDAAIGIIENTYGTTAFRRQKILKKFLLPASIACTTPLVVYLVASTLARYQQSFDPETATFLAATGILAYIGFTGTMGLVAAATQNDHMKRVTWASGISLKDRWVGEEERAALDKVVCAFGFSQSHRYGEEDGPEFQSLRQFVLLKGMIVDRVELMEGME